MKHLFILNPVAGNKDRSVIISEAVDKLHLENCEKYVTVCAKDAIREVAEQLKNTDEHLRITGPTETLISLWAVGGNI